MKFLLIYWLIANPASTYYATGNVLFEDQDSCAAALDTLAKQWPTTPAADSYAYGIPIQGLPGTTSPPKPGICVAQSTAPVVVPTAPPPAIPGIPAVRGQR